MTGKEKELSLKIKQLERLVVKLDLRLQKLEKPSTVSPIKSRSQKMKDYYKKQLLSPK